MTGLGADDRYLMVNPYFHMFGLKAGILACVASRGHHAPRGGLRRRPRSWSASTRERVTVLPGPPTLYQAILDHPDRAGTTVDAAGGGDRSRRHPRRAGPPHRRRAAVLDRHHRLRPHRGGDGRVDVARGQRRDHRHHGGPAPARLRAPHRRRRGGDVGCRGAGRGGAARRQRHGRLSRRPRGHRARRCPPRGGCGPGDIGVVDEAGACGSSGGSRTCSSSGGFNAYPAEIENLCCAIPTSARRR